MNWSQSPSPISSNRRALTDLTGLTRPKVCVTEASGVLTAARSRVTIGFADGVDGEGRPGGRGRPGHV
jgi:hypothetical protein